MLGYWVGGKGFVCIADSSRSWGRVLISGGHEPSVWWQRHQG